MVLPRASNIISLKKKNVAKNGFLPVPLGSIPELPASSCKEIKASEGDQVVSGKYWLDNITPGKAVLAYCNMEVGGKEMNTLLLYMSLLLPSLL